MLHLTHLTGRRVVEQVVSRHITVREVAEQLMHWIERTRSINAFITLDRDVVESRAAVLDAKLRATEALPLHGLPMIVKDNIDTEDFKTTCGTPTLQDHQPARNAAVVQTLVDAGVLVIGKANLDELAGGVTGNNAHFGPVRNPYDQLLIAGGSSGGTAAAIAAHQVPVGLATDTGGSARIPAALCGICGFRPSTGRYPSGGVLVLSHTRDTIGVMARTVEDIALIDQTITGSISGPPANLRDVCIAVPQDPFLNDLEDVVAAATEDAIRMLARRGARIVASNLEHVTALNEACGDGIVMAEVIPDLDKYLAHHGLPLRAANVIRQIASSGLREKLLPLLENDAVDERWYLELLRTARPRLQRMYETYFAANGADVMIYPTTPLTARPIGQDECVTLNGRDVSTFRAYCRNTDPGSNAGVPSLSIPVGVSGRGLPIGLSIDGLRNADNRVLRIGGAIQKLLPPIPPPSL